MIRDLTPRSREPAHPGARDRFGRRIRYLRLSLTDACNFRCVYCMPGDAVFRPAPELLSTGEVLRIARLFAALGLEKVRLTGGEPTLRPDLLEIVRGVAATDGIREVALTTNGSRLRELAAPLARAGLRRVNVRLDTLDPARFRAMSIRGRLETVLEGLAAAESAGLGIKINTVLVRGRNDGDDVELARLSAGKPWQVRFIELMPIGQAVEFRHLGVGEDEIRARLERAFGPLESAGGDGLDGEARVVRIPGAAGTIGFISPVSHPFCRQCDRARMTPDGKLRLCLLRENEADLLGPLRAGAPDEQIRDAIRESLLRKPAEHDLAHDRFPSNRRMSEIGG